MFRVEWLQSVLDRVAEAWLAGDAVLRQAITAASHELDHDLSRDPLQMGESRDRNRRIHFVTPLAVTFEVDAIKRVVTVLHVRVYGPRR